MNATFEIADRIKEPGDASELLYRPLEQAVTYRETRCYHFEFEGDEIRLNRFVADTLLDPISQTLFGAGHLAFTGSLFVIDFGMKPGALDLEKEAIVSYYRKVEDPGFELKGLSIRHRVYLFGESGEENCGPDVFIRDLCNPAIHNWETITD